MQIIARIRTDFHTKFGVPRQSGLVATKGCVVFEPQYRNPEALRGLEEFSHIWLLWLFSEAVRDNWSPTVRPPRLGGNKRMGVWATRSPFRPNHIGLSSVKVLKIEIDTPDGPLIWVEGADLMDGTPIVDIKPYLAFTDCHPEATTGFASETFSQKDLEVDIPDNFSGFFTQEQAKVLREVLAADPRPHYQSDSDRIYVMEYGGREVKFKVADEKVVVVDVL